jgi:transcriptional regulator with XRE-family HTH domain
VHWLLSVHPLRNIPLGGVEMSESLKALGKRIQKLRQALGLSQEALAELGGISVKNYANLERGRAINPKFSTIEGIANALGMTVAELFDLEHEQLPINEIKQRLHIIIDEASDEKARIIYHCLKSVST